MKRYSSISEITSEESFRPQNPVTRESYRHLKGPYALTEQERLECCCQKPNGNLCKRAHRKGWVAELLDGTSSVMGGNCATDKYGAESKIAQDIVRANNEIKHQRDLERFAELLEQRDLKINEIERAKNELISIEQAVLEHFQSVGTAAASALIGMSRTGNTTIRVKGIVPPERDKNGEIVKDRKSVLIDVGSLAGTTVCDINGIRATLLELKTIERTLRVATAEPAKALRSKEIKAFNATLSSQGRAIAAVEEWKKQLSRFNTNDFTLLAFAISDIGERIRVVQFGLSHARLQSSRQFAKHFIQDKESAMKNAYGVKQIHPL